MNLSKTVRCVPVLTLLALGLGQGCLGFNDDDAGDEAFILQVIPTLLGRQPLNSAEVRALHRVLDAGGREAVVDVLMERPEFVDYWTLVLADDLKVDRHSATDWQEVCYADPLLNDSMAEALTSHIINDTPWEPFCPPVELPDDGDSPTDLMSPEDIEDLLMYLTDQGHLSSQQYWAMQQSHDNSQYPYANPTYNNNSSASGPPGGGGGAGGSVGGGSSTGEYPDWGVDMWNTSRFEPDSPGVSQEYTVDFYTYAGPEFECLPFNMTDVIRSSVITDRLHPIYRAYLAPMSAWPDVGGGKENVGSTFLQAYVDRDPMCLSCHTTTYSKTDARPRNDDWDRFMPVGLYDNFTALDLEGTLFSTPCDDTTALDPDPLDANGVRLGYEVRDPPCRSGWDPGVVILDEHYGGNGGYWTSVHTSNVFRQDVMRSGNPKANETAPPSGLSPWGFVKQCVTNDMRQWDGFETSVPGYYNSWAGMAGLGENSGKKANEIMVLDLMERWKDSMDSFADYTVSPESMTWLRDGDPNAGQLVFTGRSCTGCHSGAGEAPNLSQVLPLLTDAKILDILQVPPGNMASMAPVTGTDARNLLAYLRQTYGERPALRTDDRGHALLLLVAINIVSNVYDEVMGERLSISHGHPRNLEQWNTSSQFTAQFVESGWSLKELLKAMVLSDGFARPAPAESAEAPYDMPMLPNPWADVPGFAPTSGGDDSNSVGDFVHRRSIDNLIHAVHHALGWPAPEIIGGRYRTQSGSTIEVYPSRMQMAAIGRYQTDNAPGNSQVQLDHLLAWERGVASCEKPDYVARETVYHRTGLRTYLVPSEWSDWIDLLVDASDGVQSLRSVSIALKDRLHTDPTLDLDEVDALEALYGRDLDQVFDKTLDSDKLRAHCGILLKSPQFMMSGFATPTALPVDLPTTLACVGPEPCDFTSLCEQYEEDAQDLGYSVTVDCQ